MNRTEDLLNIAATSSRRIALIGAVLALFAAGAFALLAKDSPSARADVNDNQTVCKGHLEKGDVNADDPAVVGVLYKFACSNKITGFTLFVDGHPVQTIETEVFGTDPATKAVVPADAFSCNGDLPGFGVNCVGTYTGGWHVLAGQFEIDGPLCTEPRVDPILTVVNATVTSAGKAATAIAGPFDLGRPRGCPKSKFGGKTKIPVEKDEPVIQ
jgi:hypothetical protein